MKKGQEKKPEAFKFLRSEDSLFSMWTARNNTYSLIDWMQKMERFAEDYARDQADRIADLSRENEQLKLKLINSTKNGLSFKEATHPEE